MILIISCCFVILQYKTYAATYISKNVYKGTEKSMLLEKNENNNK